MKKWGVGRSRGAQAPALAGLWEAPSPPTHTFGHPDSLSVDCVTGTEQR